MSTKIQIICTKPGMRRNGIEHPQSASYEPGHWSDADLAAFRADPSFIVQEIEGDGSVSRGPEFDAAVEAEVKKVLEAKAVELQATFSKAVADAADEKAGAEIKALKAEATAAKKAAGTATAELAALKAAAEKAAK